MTLGNLLSTNPRAKEYDNPKQALAPNVAHKHTNMNPNTYPKSCPDSILKNTGPGIAKLWRNI